MAVDCRLRFGAGLFSVSILMSEAEKVGAEYRSFIKTLFFENRLE